MKNIINTESNTPTSTPLPFDQWRSIVISLYMALVGYGVLVGIPVISSAWVELLNFSESQVGRVAGADLGGLSLGAVITSLAIRYTNRRILVLVGALIAIIANALCMLYTEYEYVLVLRVFSGIGSGIYTAVAVANLGATSRPARAFNMLLFAFAFSQALEMIVLPQLSMNGIYGFFISCYLLGLVFLLWIPKYATNKIIDSKLEGAKEQATAATQQQKIPKQVPWICLIAIIITYINIGAYWTYIELASTDGGIEGQWIGKILVWASFMSIVGCLFATLISNRFGMARPLLAALFILTLVVSLLIGGFNNINILVSVLMFNFLWLFIDVYQMGTLSTYDKSGSFAALIPGAQGLGQIIGPNIAATLIGSNLGYDAVFIMCAGASLTAMVIYATLYIRLRKISPNLADAA